MRLSIITILLLFVSEILSSVLYINSYNMDYPWAKNLTNAVVEEFHQQNVDLHIEFLDSRRDDYSKAESLLKEIISAKYDPYQFEMILVSDDNALKFTLSNRELLGGESTPIMFCGINNNSSILAKHNNINGIYEDVDLTKNFDLITEINPDISKLLVVCDKSITSSYILDELENIILSNRYRFPIKTIRIDGKEDLNDITLKVDKNSIFFSLYFQNLKGSEDSSPKEINSFLKLKTDLPIYTAWKFLLDNNIDGGYVTDGYLHGTKIARYCVEKLKQQKRDKGFKDKKLYLNHALVKSYFRGDEVLGLDINYYNQKSTIFEKLKPFYGYIISLIILLSLLYIKLKSYLKERRNVRLYSITSLRNNFNRLLDSPYLPIVIISNGTIVECNNQFLSMLSIKNRLSVIGKDFETIIFDTFSLDSIKYPTKGLDSTFDRRKLIGDENSFDVEIYIRQLENYGNFYIQFKEIDNNRDNQDVDDSSYISKILDSNPNLILLLNSNYSIEYMNNSFKLFFNANNSTFNFDHLSEFMPLFDSFKYSIKNKFNSKGSTYFTEVVDINDQRYYFKLIIQPVDRSDEDGKVLLIFSDITDIKRGEEKLKYSESRFRDLSSAASSFLFEFDNNFNLTFINDKITGILGYRSEDLLGKDFRTIILNNFTQLFEMKVKELDKFSSFNIQCSSSDKKPLWINLSLVPFIDSRTKSKGVRGAGKDISDSINYQRTLIHSKDLAEEESNKNAQLLSYIAHEVRVGLTGVMGISELINYEGEIEDYVSTINQSSNSILNHITNIIDYSKIDKGTFDLNIEQFDIFQLLEQVNEGFETKLKQKRVEFDISVEKPISHTLIGDKIRVQQILYNFIENSIEYSNENSKISLSLNYHELDDNHIKLEFILEDNGVGISEKRKQLLMNNKIDFKRNSGLGFVLAHKLIKSMGGTLSLDSSVGVGTKVNFNLNLGLGSLADKGSKRVPSKYGDFSYNFDIIVVEDDRSNQELIKVILEKLGNRVTIVSNGIEFLYEVEKRKFDIIFMDWQMPEMDGITATKLYRKDIDGKLPIVALTAAAQSGDKERFISAGMDDYISKPIALQEIKRVLHNVKESFYNIDS